MTNIYNNHIYLNNNPSWHAEDAPFKSNNILQILKNKQIHIDKIAEIGCGSGEILVELEKKLPEVISFLGYDISKNAIEIASKKSNEKIHFKLINHADEIEKTSLLLVLDVIEHIENYFEFLKSISEKSEYTIFHIPLDMCVWTLFREKMLIESKNRIGHIHLFTEDFIKEILTDFGFEIIDMQYTEPSYESNTLKQRITNQVRRILFYINPTFCTKTLGGYSIMILTKNNIKGKN